MSLLEVNDLKVHFPVRTNPFTPARDFVKAVDGVSFKIEAGRTLGLVGESGCGKTTLSRAIMRLIDPTAGTVRLDGEDITQLNGRALRERRRKFQMVFQDPYSSLNPRMTAGAAIAEPIEIHRLAKSAADRRTRVMELLKSVGLSPEHANRYPHEFSGGQRQRIAIARALAVEPRLILCDEPVSALDVSIQAQVINLLKELQRERGVAYLFISHDLAVVEHLSDDVIVMYLGRIVEAGNTAEVCRRPKHPYTEALLSAVPDIDRAPQQGAAGKATAPGDLPSPIAPPPGCAFHPRCPKVQPRCRTEAPAIAPSGDAHQVACHYPLA